MNSSKPFEVVTVGEVFINVVMSGVRARPQAGEEVFAERLRREIGGGAAVAACGLARLGARASILALVGQSDGQWLIEGLKDRGVETSHIRFHVTEPTGLTVAAAMAEGPALLTYAGANQFLKELLSDPQLHGELARARHVHLASPIDPDLLSALTGKLRPAGCSVSIDAGWRPDWLADERSPRALGQVDLFLLDEREATAMTGQSEPEAMLQALAAAGLRRVALKRGARGAMLLDQDEIIECPPHRVAPIDATGAGACFDAGFIYGFLRGESPERCLQMANICGALSTEGFGGVETFPSPDRLQSLLRSA